jgi:hypothetical protein
MSWLVAKEQQGIHDINKIYYYNWTNRFLTDYLHTTDCGIPVFSGAVWQLRRYGRAVRFVSWGVCEFISVEVSNDQA